jgi:branched-chain amino acid aminotransferase
MSQTDYCYFNGDLVQYRDIHLHISDLLFQRGYGIFDFFRCRDGRFPWLDDYVERLFTSLELSAIEPGLGKEQFKSMVFNLQEKNHLENGAFKVIVTGGYSDTLESVTGPSNMVILNLPWKRPPEATFKEGVNLIRDWFVRPNPEVKTLYYFNTLKLQKKLREFEAVDVMFHTDRISEASRANLFFVKKGEVFTPVSDILKGITRKQVLSMFSEIHLEDIGTDRLYDFDEIFLTGTSRDITPVVSIEGHTIGDGKPGPVTREIQAAFRAKGW